MNEIEILRLLIEQERIAHDLQLKIEIWNNNDEKSQFAEELDNTTNLINKLKIQISEIKDKHFSKKAKQAVIEQLESYITEINRACTELHLSRKQRFIGNNELFARIIRDINRLLTDKVGGIHIPRNLKYTVVPEDSISILELTNFCRNEIDMLKELNQPNYLELRQYKDGLVNRILNQFIN